MAEQEFVQKVFAQYYAENAAKIMPPSSIAQREFGVLIFREKMMVRHKALNTPEELRGFVISMSPSDVYYSSAYYEHPEEPMGRKGWLGADLIFDIDSDHIQTPCKSRHDYWVCESCSNTGIGVKPSACPKCGGTKFKTEGWLCESCLNAAKAETQKLLDFLSSDFGFRPENLVTCFSGQRGYHVHIEEPDIRFLDQNSRKEIVDYITGTGIKVEFQGLFETRDSRSRLTVRPDLNGLGWQGRMMRGVYDLLAAAPTWASDELGLPKGTTKLIQENRELILESLAGKSQWMPVKGLSPRTLAKLAERGIASQASAVDTVVTTDIHRLIRLPETLHGKTGLRAMEIPSQSLDRFDPLSDAVAFKKGTLEVFVQDSYSFRIGEQTFGQYHEEKVELPIAAAMYLVCKKVAAPTAQILPHFKTS